MNTLILNRESFSMPADGWYQIAPMGEFAHAQAGLVQVVDGEACAAMVNRFRAEAKGANFAGLLVDFDHFSLDGEKRSEAAGWIVALEARGENSGVSGQKSVGGPASEGPGPPAVGALPNHAGLWAQIRWSDVGEDAVKGGRYRFLSPVWARGDCVDLGNGRVRPVRLLNAAVTNDPNLKGMRPLSNRTQEPSASDKDTADNVKPQTRTDEHGFLWNAAAADRGAQRFNPPSPEGSGGTAPVGAQRYKWTLGESPEGHCPSCAALAGQVRTMAEWQASGAGPGAGGLYCQGNCHCSLEPTDDPASGDVSEVPVRKGGWRGELKMENCRLKIGVDVDPQDEALIQHLANTGWTDEARAAALAARRAKAGQRKQPTAKAGGGKKKRAAKARQGEESDLELRFREEGMGGMSQADIDGFTEQVRQKLATGKPLSFVEEGFLEERADKGYAGESDADPIYQWAERKAERESRVQDVLGVDARDARGKVTDLEFRKQQGQTLSAEEESFVETYNDLTGNRAPETTSRCPAQPAVEPGARGPTGSAPETTSRCPAQPAPEPGARCPTGTGGLVANFWTDQARLAALAVRRAKSTVRDGLVRPGPGLMPTDDGARTPGVTRTFDAKTGRYRVVLTPEPRAARGPSEPAGPQPPARGVPWREPPARQQPRPRL